MLIRVLSLVFYPRMGGISNEFGPLKIGAGRCDLAKRGESTGLNLSFAEVMYLYLLVSVDRR